MFSIFSIHVTEHQEGQVRHTEQHVQIKLFLYHNEQDGMQKTATSYKSRNLN